MKRFTQNLKVGLMAILLALGLVCPQQSSAAEKNVKVWCLKTNTGNYYPVVNVSMMVVPDDGKTFEIVLKKGKGEAGVTDVAFEKHLATIDFDLYKRPSATSGYPSTDLTKKLYLMTNTGKYFTFTSLPTMQPIAGSDKFDVVFNDVTEKNVSYVWFYRGDDPQGEMTGIDAPIMDEEENLELQTPISSQMLISGCGDAKIAEIFSTSGAKVGQAKVNAGAATVQVADLTPGIYVVKVGKKSLKFVKK